MIEINCIDLEGLSCQSKMSSYDIVIGLLINKLELGVDIHAQTHI